MNQPSMFDNGLPVKPAKPYTGKTIYETAGKAREYRELACNLYTGCDHGCTYCFAPLILHRERPDFHSNVQARPDILNKLEKDAAGYAAAGETRQVLFCFTCDPYSPAIHDTGITRQALITLRRRGLLFCTLTKGGRRALRDLDLFTPRDAFATTLTSLDDDVSRQWEPNAALPWNRIKTLAEYHAAGIPTWVSLEPVIDPETVKNIIRETAEFVDQYKVGVLNYHPRSKQIDWCRFGFEVVDLLQSLGKSYYLKDDLRKAMGITPPREP